MNYIDSISNVTPTTFVLILVTLERLAIIVCIAFIFTRFPFFKKFQENYLHHNKKYNPQSVAKLIQKNFRLYRDQCDRKLAFNLILFFSTFGILGTIFGIVIDVKNEEDIVYQVFTDRAYDQIRTFEFWQDPHSIWKKLEFSASEAIINFRVMILTVAGVVGGPVVGLVSGVIVGIQRYYLGGGSGSINFWSSTSVGLSAGLIFFLLTPKQRYSPLVVMAVCFIMEVLRRALILNFSELDGGTLMKNITLPMLIGNTIGGYVFMKVIANVNKERELIVEGEKRKEAEIKSLLLYMVPHFIISSLAVIEAKVTSAPALTKKQLFSLSTFIRNSLGGINSWSDGNNLTINDEINHVKDYLVIMQGHYPKLSFSTTFDESLLHFKCSLFVLQPLVENAINYGCKFKKEGDLISVSITSNGDKIHLTVKDNGEGMSDDIKQQLGKNQITSSRFGTGMAFYNVIQRLQNIFNNNVNYNVVSILNEGTEITINIPKEEIQNDE